VLERPWRATRRPEPSSSVSISRPRAPFTEELPINTTSSGTRGARARRWASSGLANGRGREAEEHERQGHERCEALGDAGLFGLLDGGRDRVVRERHQRAVGIAYVEGVGGLALHGVSSSSEALSPRLTLARLDREGHAVPARLRVAAGGCARTSTLERQKGLSFERQPDGARPGLVLVARLD
jgi:hypothetical protein